MIRAIITAYCNCLACCGPSSPEAGGHGLTASGRRPVPGLTIAAPRSVPFGTRVFITIPGVWTRREFRVDDRTARRHDGKWDVFLPSHLQAREFGVKRGLVEFQRK